MCAETKSAVSVILIHMWNKGKCVMRLLKLKMNNDGADGMVLSFLLQHNTDNSEVAVKEIRSKIQELCGTTSGVNITPMQRQYVWSGMVVQVECRFGNENKNGLLYAFTFLKWLHEFCSSPEPAMTRPYQK